MPQGLKEPTVGRGAAPAPEALFAGAQRFERFVEELSRMTPKQRIAAYRECFGRTERTIWAARYPDEVPLVNGEFEWIALRLP